MNEVTNLPKAGSRVGTVWGIAVAILGVLAMMAPLVTGESEEGRTPPSSPDSG